MKVRAAVMSLALGLTGLVFVSPDSATAGSVLCQAQGYPITLSQSAQRPLLATIGEVTCIGHPKHLELRVCIQGSHSRHGPWRFIACTATDSVVSFGPGVRMITYVTVRTPRGADWYRNVTIASWEDGGRKHLGGLDRFRSDVGYGSTIRVGSN